MNIRSVLIVVAVVVGLALGPSALSSAAAAQPPIRWNDLAFIFVGSAIALFLVLAFQVLLRNYKAFTYGWSAFSLMAFNVVATGISALATSVVTVGLHPHSLMFLVVGSGMSLAVVLLRAAFGGRLQNAA
jgi:hypothetical protein